MTGHLMTDWREQEYEDNYWDERVQLMERAIEQAVATRHEERAYVIEDLLGA